jgi:hypothetical protein
MSFRRSNINNNANPKPKTGDMSNESPTSVTLAQFNATSWFPGRRIKANPTPKMEPISVCELEQGIPMYHVERFQMIAVRISEKTIATLCARFWSRITSKGRRFMMPMATTIPPTFTPTKFQKPDHITAIVGFNECV